MASDARSKGSKQMTISFTLPISCQICLGKVKQPVLCSNHHVFCSLCLEIWLNRNSQCPACRVDIGPDNPVKHIIGGHVEDEECDKKSSPDLRRARFDLLYQEYEDQLEQMKKENIVLTTENNILIAQLRDAENKSDCKDRNENHTTKSDEVPAFSAHLLQASDGPSLLMLTKKLHQAQKLYSTIKAHMSELKQENCKLKDENVHLTRENDVLRLEIAQRSPKKFGRYTVATLETRISEQEKEIRQLKKALECSDTYIEELQCRQETLHQKDGGRKLEASLPYKARFHFNLEPKNSAGGNGLFKDIQHKEKHCKVLFGKVVDEEGNQASKKFDVSAGIKPSHQQHSSKVTNTITQDFSEFDVESEIKQSNSNSRNSASTSKLTEAPSTSRHQAESQIQCGVGATKYEFFSKGATDEDFQERNPKKVHFNVCEKSEDISSFDLDLPSPASSSLVSDSVPSMNKELAPTAHMSASQAGPSRIFESQTTTNNTPSLVGKSDKLQSRDIVALDSKLFTLGMPSHPQAPGSSKKSKQIQGKARKTKSSAVSRKIKQVSEDANDSSHLSVPDVAIGDTVDSLNSTDEVTEHADGDDPDIFMTPELTHCLQLMNQAERNIQHPAAKGSSTIRVPFPTTSAPDQSNPFPVYSIPLQTNAPPTDTMSYKLPSTSQNFPAYTGLSWHNPSGTVPSSWEQHFYSSLKVNPYKHTTTLNQPKNFPWRPHNDPHTENKSEASIDNKQDIHSLLDLYPAKKTATNIDFTFSNPVKVSLSSSSKPRDSYTFSDPGVPDLGRNVLNPFSINLNTPSISTVSPSFPTTSSAYYSTAVTTSGHNFKTSTTSGFNFTTPRYETCNGSSNMSSPSTALSSPSDLSSPKSQISKKSFSSSHLELPSKGSDEPSCDKTLSSSLNTSELEWPEDS